MAVWKFQLFSTICMGSENEQPFGSSRNSPTWRHKEDAREERGTGNGEKWTGKWKMGNNLTWTPALSVTSFPILCFVPIFLFPISRTHSSFQGNLVTSQRSTVLCFHRHVIENKKKFKPFNTESPECEKWKKINTQKTSPEIRFVPYFISQIFGKMFYPNLQSFVWRRHIGVSLRGTNMAAGNQQKHLSLSFPSKAWLHHFQNS